MYANGQGVAQNNVQAHLWLALATARGMTISERDRDNVAAKMTSADLAEARRLAREWQAKHVK